MAISRKKKGEAAAKAAEAKKEEQQAVVDNGRTARKPSQAQLKEEEYLQKAMKGFHPDVVTFFKDKLGLELQKLDVKTLYDLQQGKLTKPLELIVVPLVYDRSKKADVEMPRIKVVASLKASLPYANGKPLAPDAEDNRIFISSLPCRPLLEDSVDNGIDAGVEKHLSTGERPMPTFTEEQMMALEGVGINRERLFGGFNHLSYDEKCAIADGEKFMVDGAVKTDFGFVNVIGVAKLNVGKDDKVGVDFEPFYSEAREAGKVIDIMDARINGSLELDVFRRDGNNKMITNVNGLPILNTAGSNLVTYGMAMEPVRGYIHTRKYDQKENKFVDKVKVQYYQVSVANGNLFATPMREVKTKGLDGKEITSYEVQQARVRDGKVFIDGKVNEPLEFASKEDMKNYLEGRGGKVLNAVYHDFKSNKDITYTAFVVPDNTRAGFARQFTPETSKKLIERQEKSQKKGVARKKNFSVSL